MWGDERLLIFLQELVFFSVQLFRSELNCYSVFVHAKFYFLKGSASIHHVNYYINLGKICGRFAMRKAET